MVNIDACHPTKRSSYILSSILLFAFCLQQMASEWSLLYLAPHLLGVAGFSSLVKAPSDRGCSAGQKARPLQAQQLGGRKFGAPLPSLKPLDDFSYSVDPAFLWKSELALVLELNDNGKKAIGEGLGSFDTSPFGGGIQVHFGGARFTLAHWSDLDRLLFFEVTRPPGP